MNKQAKGLVIAASVVGAFAAGVAVGKDAGRSSQTIEDLNRDRATQAYADCILLRGKDACVEPSEPSQ